MLGRDEEVWDSPGQSQGMRVPQKDEDPEAKACWEGRREEEQEGHLLPRCCPSFACSFF